MYSTVQCNVHNCNVGYKVHHGLAPRPEYWGAKHVYKHYIAAGRPDCRSRIYFMTSSTSIRYVTLIKIKINYDHHLIN